MILYNIRANGPYEYDKFTLNVLQLIADVRKAEETLEQTALLLGTAQTIQNLEQAYDDTIAQSNKIQTAARQFLY